MRTRTILFSLSLALVGMPALAQNTADQSGSASQQEMQGNSMQGSDSMKSMETEAQKTHGMHKGDGKHKGDGMQSQHQAMMKSAQNSIDGMRSHLEKMKEQTKNISDKSHRDSMESNNDMWQGLIEHMDAHMANMQNMMASRDGKLCSTTRGDEVAAKRYSQ